MQHIRCPDTRADSLKHLRDHTHTHTHTHTDVLKLRHSPGAKRQWRRVSYGLVFPRSPETSSFLYRILLFGFFCLFFFTLDNIYNNKHSLNKSLPNTATPSRMKFRICHHLQQTLQYIQQNKYIVVNSQK